MGGTPFATYLKLGLFDLNIDVVEVGTSMNGVDLDRAGLIPFVVSGGCMSLGSVFVIRVRCDNGRGPVVEPE